MGVDFVHEFFKFNNKYNMKSIDNLFKLINKNLYIKKKIENFAYSAIEWRALNYLDLNKDQSKKMVELLIALEQLDDVQNIFTNAKIEN